MYIEHFDPSCDICVAGAADEHPRSTGRVCRCGMALNTHKWAIHPHPLIRYWVREHGHAPCPAFVEVLDESFEG